MRITEFILTQIGIWPVIALLEVNKQMSKPEKSKAKSSSQGGLMMWHGMTISGLAKLIGRGPNIHWSRLVRFLSLFPMVTYNSIMSFGEKLVYGRKVKNTELVNSPIFILGHWRSGTTLIHNLITSDPQFTSPTLYQTLFPHHFLLTETVAKKLTAAFVPKTRPMDNMAVHWDVPQEDELALCVMCQVSPYLNLAFPQKLDLFRELLDIESLPAEQQQLWKDTLLKLLKKITTRHPKQVVLKSPSHTFRVKTILKLFPDAKFVYIYRQPLDVFNSTCHLRKKMIDNNTMGKSIYKDLENDVLLNYETAIAAYEADKHLIPEGHLHEVKYEELEVNPLAEMERIYENLQLENVEDMRSAVEPQIEKLKNYKKNKFDPDPHWAKIVYERCRDIYEKYGYSPPAAVQADQQLETEKEPAKATTE